MIEKLWKFCKDKKEILLYLIFGGLTTVVSLGSFWLFDHVMGIDVLWANVLSWICAVVFAYITNSIWVFEAKPKSFGEFVKQFVSFCAGRLLTLGIEELMLFLLVKVAGLPSMWVKLAAQVVVVILNYVFSKLFVFRKKKEAPSETEAEEAAEAEAETLEEKE